MLNNVVCILFCLMFAIASFAGSVQPMKLIGTQDSIEESFQPDLTLKLPSTPVFKVEFNSFSEEYVCDHPIFTERIIPYQFEYQHTSLPPPFVA